MNPPFPTSRPAEPPELGPVDVTGYRSFSPALPSLLGTAARYQCPVHGTVWPKPGVPPCDCDEFLDADP